MPNYYVTEDPRDRGARITARYPAEAVRYYLADAYENVDGVRLVDLTPLCRTYKGRVRLPGSPPDVWQEVDVSLTYSHAG